MGTDLQTGEGPAVQPPAGRWEAAADRAWGLIRRVHLGTKEPANWVQLFHFNLIVFTLLAKGADMNHLLAAVGAFVVAVTNNFLLNRHWTFRHQGSKESHAGFQAARFFTVSLVGLGVNLVILELLVSAAGMAELPSQAIAVALATPVNFIGNKLWTFDR